VVKCAREEEAIMRLDLHPALGANRANASVRLHTRALFSIPIALHYLTRDGLRTTRGVSLDISEGGLGALVQGGLLEGQTVEIDLRLREHPLSTVAIVRYTSSLRSGFEFLGLTAEERMQITNLAGNC
jgi:c-di-GMP-binding flagellar brake protein YcgR